MSEPLVGVAISTTGDPHRIALLQQAALRWKTCLPYDAHMVVTVDGSEADAEQVRTALGPWRGEVHRVGQPVSLERVRADWPRLSTGDFRLGVATNKNTGLELLMKAGVEHLFLSDDDTWPLYAASLEKHLDLPMEHSMVCWGSHRLDPNSGAHYWAEWTWPRGVMLYQSRAAVETVGGMDERFGLGGHEHVEYSGRMRNAGMSPAPFCSPASYATRNGMGAAALWHAEDMPRPGEARHVFAARKKAHTSVRTTREDWGRIDKIMAERAGSSDFVPFRAADNGRGSATLCTSKTSLGAEK